MKVGVLVLGLCLLSAGTSLAVAGAAKVAASSSPSVRVVVSSPTHAPQVNVPWPVRVSVSDAKGKPLAATLTMLVLFAGQRVGTIDKGAVYRFVGTWQERRGNEITWPPASRGEPLTLQFVVKALGVTTRKNWAITVR